MPETVAKTRVDADTEQLMRDLEQGLAEAKLGAFARVTTPAQIAQRDAKRNLGDELLEAVREMKAR